jgi:hypothetical protein
VIFSPLYAVLMDSHVGHLLMQLMLLGAGLAFVIAVVDRSMVAIALPMIAWPFILLMYPSIQALANVLVTEVLLIVLFVRTRWQMQASSRGAVVGPGQGRHPPTHSYRTESDQQR